LSIQFLADGLIAGASIGLAAIGVTLTYSILGFANFAHGEFISWGCYLTWGLAAAIGALLPSSTEAIGAFSVGWNIVLASLLAMLLTGAMAVTLDSILFRPLRARGASITAVIASFGASMALRALLEALVPSRQAYLSTEIAIAIPLAKGLRVTPDQLMLLAAAGLLACALQLLITRSHIGRSMRAVSQNQELARIAGIDVAHVIRVTWFMGGALACAAGVILGLVVQMRPSMGADVLLPLFAAAILGGIGSVPGALFGGLIVGLAEAAAVQWCGSQWRAAVAFIIVIVVLLIRPSGLCGAQASRP
jgi:branched-chain amino acid transport system permease protein